MKRITLTFSLLLWVCFSFAQPFTSITENFDASCGGVAPSLPMYWMDVNPTGTLAQGTWQCTPSGRPTSTGAPTPGVSCTGTFSSIFHVDTSYLVAPELIFPGSGHLYLRFDVKAVPVAANLELYTRDSFAIDTSHPGINVTSSVVPPFGPIDSVWTTHEIDLSSYMGPFYIAFRYTSDASSGNIWYLDNVNTAATSITLSAKNIKKADVAISVNESTRSKITLTYDVAEAGAYRLQLYDMLGREFVNRNIMAAPGRQTITLDDLNLVNGMYFLRMANNARIGTAKVVVR